MRVYIFLKNAQLLNLIILSVKYLIWLEDVFWPQEASSRLEFFQTYTKPCLDHAIQLFQISLKLLQSVRIYIANNPLHTLTYWALYFRWNLHLKNESSIEYFYMSVTLFGRNWYLCIIQNILDEMMTCRCLQHNLLTVMMQWSPPALTIVEEKSRLAILIEIVCQHIFYIYIYIIWLKLVR